jgi:phosphate acetyltransferase
MPDSADGKGRNVYLTAIEPRSGKTMIALGLVNALSRQLGRVGYFRPVIASASEPDPDVELIRGRYRLAQSYEESYAVTMDDLRALSDRGRYDELLKRILESFRQLDTKTDLVLVEGGDFTGASRALELDFNAELANHMGCLVLLVVNGHGRSVEEVLAAAALAHGSVTSRGCTIVATFCTRVEGQLIDELRRRLPEAVGGDELVYVLPEVPALDAPTVAEVAEALSARFLRPEEGPEAPSARREVRSVIVGAMSVPNFLEHLGPGGLVVVPGDRPDVIIGSLAARISGTYPDIAGLLLTGGLVPEPPVMRLIDGLGAAAMPVLSIGTDTYHAAAAAGAVRGTLTADAEAKIATALGIFEEHVNTDALQEHMAVTRSRRVTPLMFEQELIERAKSERKHIVLPEGSDDRILQAADQLLRRVVADLTILGNEVDILTRAANLNLDLGGARLVDPLTSEWREQFADTYYELRRHKGVARTLASDLMTDVAYFGTMMVHGGLADGMVSGAVHTTAHTIRPAFEVIRTKPGVSVVSSVFLMLLRDRVLVYGDCAVLPDPNAEQLADVAISSAETAEMFGIEPRIAMLSYSTGASGTGADVDKVREATRIARQRRPDLLIEGPIQYDAAIDPAVARTKLPDSQVAGRATVFVFPDLNTGNNTYKAVQRSAGAVAVGPILQGLRKPVNDLSRGALVADIVNTVAITAIQAQKAAGS